MGEEMIFRMNEDGKWEKVEEPYMTIECQTEDDFNALKAAIDKQRPKKPEYQADGYADGGLVYDTAFCPVCRREFEYNINEWGCSYCPDCGQALDWSTEAEEEEQNNDRN